MGSAVIVNPAAAGGRARLVAERVAEAARGRFDGVDVLATSAPGHARDLAESAARSGATRIFSVGGDGTHGEVAGGIAAGQAEDGAVTLVPMPAGTGGDFTRLLRWGHDLDAALAALDEPGQRMDLGLVRYINHQGASEERSFLNMASVGMSAAVDVEVAQTSKRFGGNMTFFLGTVKALLKWKPPRARVFFDDEDMGEHLISVVCGCNGRYAGGGMAFAPEAMPDDGLLDAVILPERPLIDGARGLAALYKGTILQFPGVIWRRVKTLRIEPVAGRVALDLDGETPGVGPVQISLKPGVLSVAGLLPEILAAPDRGR